MTTRKTTTRKGADKQSVFDKYRERAGNTAKIKNITDKPYNISAELGLDEDILINRPNYKTRMAISDAMQGEDVLRALTLLVGVENLNLILDALTEYEEETGENPDPIMIGLFMDVLEHFFGKGAASTSFLQPRG